MGPSAKSIKQKLENYEPIPEAGCWIWCGTPNKDGYGMASVSKKKVLAHRLSYEFHVGEIPAGKYVCHMCDVPCCINPAHLFVGTQNDNLKDMARKGRSTRGTKQHCAILDEEKVIAIRNDRRTLGEIASEYGVKKITVWKVKNMVTWRHVGNSHQRIDW